MLMRVRASRSFFRSRGGETVELTIPDGAHIRGDLRQMQSLILGLKAEPCDQLRCDGDRLLLLSDQRKAGALRDQSRSWRASETRTAFCPGEAENGSAAAGGIIGAQLVLIQDARAKALRYNC